MAKAGDFLFERGAFGPENEMLRREDALDRCANFGADSGVLRGQVHLRNRFLRSGDVRVYAHTESVSQNRAIALRPGRLGRSGAAAPTGIGGRDLREFPRRAGARGVNWVGSNYLF